MNSSQVNEARLGWNRFAEGFFPEDSTFNPASIGLDTGVSSFNYGLPKISVGGFSMIGATASVPRQRVDTNWHFIDNYSWKIGRHDLKFGYEFRRTSINIMQNSNFRGKLSFDDLTAFLEGLPSGGSQASGIHQPARVREQQRSCISRTAFRMDHAADAELRPALGLLRRAGREEQSVLPIYPRQRRHPAASGRTGRSVAVCTTRTTTTLLRALPSPTT